jgi:hypothetical protein
MLNKFSWSWPRLAADALAARTALIRLRRTLGP